MCLIVAQPIGAPDMTEQEIRDAWQANPDGAGYVFARDGQLIVRKPFFKVKELIADYQAHRADAKGCPFVVHFRMATHGSKCKENTHPFISAVDGSLAVAHNGILPVNPIRENWSDTRSWLAMSYDMMPASAILANVTYTGSVIGRFNKFAILTASGQLAFVNEEEGVWEGGNWYSSQSARGGQRCWGFRTWDQKEIDRKEARLYRELAREICEEEGDAPAYGAADDDEEDGYEAWEHYLREHEGKGAREGA